MNLGGPSESVYNREQAGYTVRSGVIMPLSHLSLITLLQQKGTNLFLF